MCSNSSASLRSKERFDQFDSQRLLIRTIDDFFAKIQEITDISKEKMNRILEECIDDCGHDEELDDSSSISYDCKTDDVPYDDLVNSKIVKKDGFFQRSPLSLDERLSKIEHIETCNKIDKIGELDMGYASVWIANVQNCIRKSDFDGAMKSVVELCSWGGKIVDLLVEVLCKVTVIDDINFENLNLAEKCSKFLQFYARKKGNSVHVEENPHFKNGLMELVEAMATSKKSRLIVHIAFYLSKKTIGKKSNTPGKEFDSLLDRFKSEATHIFDGKPLDEEDEPDDIIRRDDFKINYDDPIKTTERVEKLCISILKMCSLGGTVSKGTKITVDADLKSLFNRKKKKIYLIWKFILTKSKYNPQVRKMNKYILKLYNASISDISSRNFSIISPIFGLKDGSSDAIFIICAFLNIIFNKMGIYNTPLEEKKDDSDEKDSPDNTDLDDMDEDGDCDITKNTKIMDFLEYGKVSKEDKKSMDKKEIEGINEKWNSFVLEKTLKVRSESYCRISSKELKKLKGRERTSIWFYFRYSCKIVNDVNNVKLLKLEDHYYRKCLNMV